MLRQSQCDCGNGEAKRWHTLTVQSPAGTAGSDGHIDYTDDANWTTEGKIKAYFVSRSGREFVQARQVQADHTQTVETISSNFSRGILPSWRLVFGSRKFEIASVVDLNEMRQTVQIEVKEHK
jgi:SPP1 family predicted phage head-tail adaptor